MPRTITLLPADPWLTSPLMLCLIVSVRTKVPAMNMTPSTTASAVSARRSLWAMRLLRVAFSTRRLAPEGLHLVEHQLGRGAVHLADHPSVHEEDRPVGVAGGDRVVGDHDHGLAKLPHRVLHDVQHLGPGPRVEVARGLVGEDD